MRSMLSSCVFASLILGIAGMLLAVPAQAQGTTTYALGEATELLDAAFYAGQAEDGSNIAGRMAFWGGASNNGQTVAFWGINAATYQKAMFLVDIGDPSSWRRLTTDGDGSPESPITWTPDDQFIVSSKWRIPVATGEWLPYTVYGQTPWESSIAVFPAGCLLFHATSALPVLRNGAEDSSRQPIEILNFSDPNLSITWTMAAADGSAMAFVDFHKVSGVPDTGDIYVLKNLAAVLNAPLIPETSISSLAPTSLSDPNIAVIRADETPNLAIVPSFSADNSLVIFSEDQNNAFQANRFFETMPLADFDIMISRADGSGDDLRLAREGNQGAVSVTPGGTRLLYISNSGSSMHLYISTLEVITPITGDPVGEPEDNAIQTTAEVTASDASGTDIVVPASTIIDFPDGTPQEIQITTPIDPIETPELPPDIEAIPVVREFGPEGTTFSEPVTVTITYTDAEIAGYDETALRVFTYNPGTGKFDIEVTTIIARDTANNTISFTVTHFSLYGLAAPSPGEMPLQIAFPAAVALLAFGLLRRRMNERRR